MKHQEAFDIYFCKNGVRLYDPSYYPADPAEHRLIELHRGRIKTNIQAVRGNLAKRMPEVYFDFLDIS